MAADSAAAPVVRIDRPWRLALASAGWLVYLAFVRPGAFDPAWPHALLLLAAMVLVPVALAQVRAAPDPAGDLTDRALAFATVAHLPAALLLLVAYGQDQGPWAAVAAVPWLLFALAVALAGLARIGRRGLRRWREEIGPITTDAGLVFLAVGAAWAFADRLGYRPLGFSPVIVLLTAVHFHYAGFVLPVVAGHAIRAVTGDASRPGLLPTLTGLGAIVGVPAVAVGITTAQLGLPREIEAVAAWIMAASGLLVAGLHLKLAADRRRPALARALWTIAALALAAGMVLAAAYGSRFLLPEVRWLDIAWMQALHGASNSLGFAVPALWGWRVASRSSRDRNGSPASRTR